MELKFIKFLIFATFYHHHRKQFNRLSYHMLCCKIYINIIGGLYAAAWVSFKETKKLN